MPIDVAVATSAARTTHRLIGFCMVWSVSPLARLHSSAVLCALRSSPAEVVNLM